MPKALIIIFPLLVGGTGAAGMRGRDRFGDTYANNTMKKMIALYDYDPQVLYFLSISNIF